MNPFGTRGTADELARLLDSPFATGPGPALALRLRGLGDELASVSGPRPEFRAALRTRLLAVATVQAAAPAPVAVPAAVSWRTRTTTRATTRAATASRRGSAVAAGALASVVAVSGVAVAGSQSLPGDPFYGVKRGVEALQLQTADGSVEEGTRHLDLAGTRLREVRGLVLGRDAVDTGALSLAAGAVLADGADASLVRETLADMDASTREGRALLTSAYREDRVLEPLTALSSFADRQAAGLEQLLPSLPDGSVAAARASLALVADVGEQADDLLALGTCGVACDPTEVAPVLPPAVPVPGASPSAVDEAEAPCGCATPTPEPQPAPTTGPADPADPSSSPEPRPTATPSPSASPSPTAEPTPSPSPTGGPLPLPSLPVPVPSLPVPVPVPSISLPPLPPLVWNQGELPTGTPAEPAPVPLSAPAAPTALVTTPRR